MYFANTKKCRTGNFSIANPAVSIENSRFIHNQMIQDLVVEIPYHMFLKSRLER